MTDAQIHRTIEQLVSEEHELWERESTGNATDADRKRLQELKILARPVLGLSPGNGEPSARPGSTRTLRRAARKRSSSTMSNSRSDAVSGW